ncbi:MAG: KpsF/GutQ family sugar-phosphate isomerase [Chlamydiales bacterium]|nr:KpsF/GutQ family sugar-phosphate isomerase [Chlamydiales bacterium]
MFDKLFRSQQKYINYFFDHLDIELSEELLQKLLSCTGIVFFTGVGKSGIIAQKIAVTLVSTGTKAIYLSPTDTLHGDLGIITKNDIFVCFSKSGESEELLQLLPFIRNKGSFLVAIVSNLKSRLARACDMAIHLPLERELCPFDLAPTTSTAIQLIFGDVLTVGLMRARNFSLSEYAINHPAGRIGRRTTLLVKDIMLTGEKLPLCRRSDKLVDSLVELSDKRCGCLLVIDDKMHLEGIFTDGDLRRALQTFGASVLEKGMENLMVKSPRFTIPEKLAWEAMQFMENDIVKPITVLPVIKEDKLVGLVKMHDLIQSGL